MQFTLTPQFRSSALINDIMAQHKNAFDAEASRAEVDPDFKPYDIKPTLPPPMPAPMPVAPAPSPETQRRSETPASRRQTPVPPALKSAMAAPLRTFVKAEPTDAWPSEPAAPPAKRARVSFGGPEDDEPAPPPRPMPTSRPMASPPPATPDVPPGTVVYVQPQHPLPAPFRTASFGYIVA